MKNPTFTPLFTLILTFTLSLGGDLARAGTEAPAPTGGKVPAIRPRPSRQAAPPRIGPPVVGDPLPGLTAAQLADFAAGKEEFEHEEDEEGGLGPIFNNTSCVACHSAGATGGGGPINVVRFGRVQGGIFDPLDSLGGSLLQQNAIDAAVQEIVPREANVRALRQSTPLFGLGLIEAIPDDAIRRNALHPVIDGVRGKVSTVTDVATGQQRVGRFGWKAQQAGLLSFAGDAYLNEMGITSRLFPQENAPNGDLARLAAYDAVLDPEDTVDPASGKSDIDAAADFMRFLAPPPPVPLTREANDGQKVFRDLNCAICHTPMMGTGPSPVASLNFKPVPLYSDLLLHDMGALGDGIVQGQAGAREMKTPPLWGLRFSAPYLHDGRAATLEAAIRAHDGEARVIRDRYVKLPPQAQGQLAAFLRSL